MFRDASGNVFKRLVSGCCRYCFFSFRKLLCARIMAKALPVFPVSRNLKKAAVSSTLRLKSRGRPSFMGRFLYNMSRLFLKLRNVFRGVSVVKVAAPKWNTSLWGTTNIFFPDNKMRQQRSISSMWAKNRSSNPPVSRKSSVRIKRQAPDAQNISAGVSYCPLSGSTVEKMRPRQ